MIPLRGIEQGEDRTGVIPLRGIEQGEDRTGVIPLRGIEQGEDKIGVCFSCRELKKKRLLQVLSPERKEETRDKASPKKQVTGYPRRG